MTFPSNRLTPAGVLDALSRGHAVDLEGPGWDDTGSGPCPGCGKVTGYFKARPQVRFYYGIDLCRPHRCGKDLPWRDQGLQPRVAQLERVQRERDAIAAQTEGMTRPEQRSSRP